MNSEVQARIDNVTVFADGARITRSGKIKLETGLRKVVIGGITAYADQDSFRVQGRGNAVLRGINISKESRLFEPEGDLKTLKAKLEKLLREKEGIEDRMRNEERRISNLNSITHQFAVEFGKWYAAGDANIEDLTVMDQKSLKLIQDAKKSLREANRELQDKENEIQAIQAQIGRIEGERRTETFLDVYVTLDVKSSDEIELDIEYQVDYAGWTPTYDIDLDEDKASIKRIAMIQNSTREDWSDVSLKVSTASSSPVAIVEGHPYYIDTHTAREPKPMRARMMAREALEEAAPDYAAGEPIPEMELQYAIQSERLSGTVVYDVPAKVTIPSDNDSHPITLTLETVDSKVLHYWNAYAMTEVVVQNEITNTDSLLLPGPAKVYAKGDYIGETHLKSISPREKFQLGTRTSYDVKAEKKLTSKDTEKAGFTGSKRRRDYTYRLDIESFSKNPIEVHVVDRIPHSASEKISIELESVTPSVEKSEMGVLEWRTRIDPETKVTIGYSFSVQWEKDVIIRPNLP